jgi:hypothetical protein
VPNGTVSAEGWWHTRDMLKKGITRRPSKQQTNKQTLASVKKEMRQPRLAESVRQEEITHLHIQLQRRKAS